MPRQVVFTFLIQLALVFITTFFLIQPKIFFSPDARRWKAIGKASGFVLLCITFCWSVVLGCVFALNGIMITWRV